jgi:hypothetical protein
MKSASYLGILFLGTSLAGFAHAQETPVASDDIGIMNPAATASAFPGRGFSPYAGRHYPTRPLWGDQHVHTGWSVDAGAFGATLGPEEALRFARGEEIMSSMGLPAKLSRPLDWVAVTDHSDAAGVIFEIKDGNPELMADPQAKRWHDMMADQHNFFLGLGLGLGLGVAERQGQACSGQCQQGLHGTRGLTCRQGCGGNASAHRCHGGLTFRRARAPARPGPRT